MNYIDHFHLKVNAMGDGGPDGGGGGGTELTREESRALSIAGASPTDISEMGGYPGETGEREVESTTGKLLKIFGLSSALTGNPALGLIATGLYLGADAIATGTATPGEAPAVGNIGAEHPELSQFGGSVFTPGLKATETPTEQPPPEVKPPEKVEVVTPEQEAAENRRKAARKRTGYWSTRLGGGGEADIFTPSLFTT